MSTRSKAPQVRRVNRYSNVKREEKGQKDEGKNGQSGRCINTVDDDHSHKSGFSNLQSLI